MSASDPTRFEADFIEKLLDPMYRVFTGIANEHNAIVMGQGISKIPSPEILINAGRQAMLEDVTYAPASGHPGLREAAFKYMQDWDGFGTNEELDLIVGHGATGLYFANLMSLSNPGDKVLLFSPFFPQHHDIAIAHKLEPVIVPLRQPGFRFDKADVEMAFKQNDIKFIVIANPGNPSGTVLNFDELNFLGKMCQDHDAILICEAIYKHFFYDEVDYFTPFSVPALDGRVIVTESASKTLSATGFRVGWQLGPKHLMDKVVRSIDLSGVCANKPCQVAVEAALLGLAQDYYDKLRDSFQHKRDTFLKYLQQSSFDVCSPEGAYYGLFDYSAIDPNLSPYDFNMKLLKDFKVSFAPGTDFLAPVDKLVCATPLSEDDLRWLDPATTRTLRCCYAVENPVLSQAMTNLEHVKSRWSS